MFKDNDDAERIRAAFGRDVAHWAEWFPLWQPLEDVTNWFNIPRLTEEGCFWVCFHLAEFFTEEQLTVGTVPTGTRGESKVSFAKLTLVPDLQRIPLTTIYKIQGTADLQKRFDLIFAELRKVRANEYPALRIAPPAAKSAQARPAPAHKEPIAPARSRPALPTVRPGGKISTRHLESDIRSIKRLMAPFGFPPWVVKMVCRIRRHAVFHRASGDFIFCTFQKREAKKWGVSHRTARRQFRKVLALRIIWYKDPGSPANRRPILGIVKNSRDHRRRWAKRKLIERNSRKVVQFKRPRNKPPGESGKDFSSTPPPGKTRRRFPPDPDPNR